MKSTNAFHFTSPIKPEQIGPGLREYLRLQCSTTLSAADCALLNPYLEANPDTVFRLYSSSSTASVDPAFLSHLPALRDLWLEINAGTMIDLAPLATLPTGLRALTLDTVAGYSDRKLDRPKKSSEVLGRLGELEFLSFCGQLPNLELLGRLPALRSLSLFRTKLKSLAGLEAASQLRSLDLHASGAKDLTPVAALRELERLEIDAHRNLPDLAPLTDLPKLRRLWLLSCTTTGAMPSFARLRSLRVAAIHKLVTPANLPQIAAAPALRCLILSGSPTLHSVDALQPLAGHPTLEELRLETWDDQLFAAIHAAYGWKVTYCNLPAEEYL